MNASRSSMIVDCQLSRCSGRENFFWRPSPALNGLDRARDRDIAPRFLSHSRFSCAVRHVTKSTVSH